MFRASLLTGCYNVRISVPSIFQPNSTTGLIPEETNIANLFKKEGYTTACIEKWHLGHLPEFMPLNQGFDVYLGIPHSNNMIKGYMQGRAPELPLYDGTKILAAGPDQSQFTKRFTDRAVEFITENKDKPFFLYLPHPMIHTPLLASEDFKGKSMDEILGDAIAGLTKSKLDPARRIDGVDIPRLMFESEPGPVRETQLSYGRGSGKLDAIRQAQWKLFLGTGNKKSAANKKRSNQGGKGGKHDDGAAICGLYDLSKDPGETTDLSNQYPEVVASHSSIPEPSSPRATPARPPMDLLLPPPGNWRTSSPASRASSSPGGSASMTGPSSWCPENHHCPSHPSG